MLCDLTAKELRTVRIIQSKQLIGNDRRDMTLARAAAVIACSMAKVDSQDVVKYVFPLEIPEHEQTADEMFGVLQGMMSHGPKHSDTSG